MTELGRHTLSHKRAVRFASLPPAAEGKKSRSVVEMTPAVARMMIHFALFVVNGLQPAKAGKSGLLVLFVSNGHTKSAHQVMVSLTFAIIVMIAMNRHLTVVLVILRAVDFELKRYCFYMLYLSKAGHAFRTYEVLL